MIHINASSEFAFGNPHEKRQRMFPCSHDLAYHTSFTHNSSSDFLAGENQPCDLEPADLSLTQDTIPPIPFSPISFRKGITTWNYSVESIGQGKFIYPLFHEAQHHRTSYFCDKIEIGTEYFQRVTIPVINYCFYTHARLCLTHFQAQDGHFLAQPLFLSLDPGTTHLMYFC
jgi:hypothetical protein